MTPCAVWGGVGRLVDRARSFEDLRAHRLHLLAAHHWRTTGMEVPAHLAMQELIAIQRMQLVRELVQAARDAYDGAMLVLKGSEVATHYQEPWLRPSTDVDLLVDDAERAQAALIGIGFEPVGHDDSYYAGLHHLRPLRVPGSAGPLLEIHRRPNWVGWLYPPDTEALFDAGVQSATGVPGVLGLPPAPHAVVLTAHAWGERPLSRLLDLVDVAALLTQCHEDEVTAVADAWDLRRLWQTTNDATHAVVLGTGHPSSLRIWARGLRSVRDNTVIEKHIGRWLSPFWSLPPHRALVASGVSVAHDLTPTPEETWTNKRKRIREGLRHPLRSVTEHQRRLGPEGVRARFKRRP